MKIGIQGLRGAHSENAAIKLYPKAEIITCATFEDCFKLAQENDDYKIMIPIENSSSGRVADIQYLIPKYNLQIYSEYFHLVNHHLLGLPGSKLENMKKVRSHAQAISQCQKFIIQNNLEPIITADTAGSAKYISQNKIKSEAAIASSLAAKIYDLDILAKDIEDESGNVTRFLVMGKNAHHPSFLKDKKYITSVIFKVRSKPAALYSALGGFAINQGNLCKLESFSEKNSFVNFSFLCDCEGHIEEPRIKSALEELGLHCESLVILGVYEASSFRQL